MTPRTFAFIAAVAGLVGCSPVDSAFLGASLVTYVHTDKTLTDHAVSMITEKNCSIRHSANNQPYCQPLGLEDSSGDAPYRGPIDSEQYVTSQQSYCYRTLGEITCYREPDHSASAASAMQ